MKRSPIIPAILILVFASGSLWWQSQRRDRRERAEIEKAWEFRLKSAVEKLSAFASPGLDRQSITNLLSRTHERVRAEQNSRSEGKPIRPPHEADYYLRISDLSKEVAANDLEKAVAKETDMLLLGINVVHENADLELMRRRIEEMKQPPAAYFEFADATPKGVFVIKLTDSKRIAEARSILSNGQTNKTHIAGQIVKQKVSYNPGWSFHLRPESISFFEIAMEVCDTRMDYVEQHLDTVGGAFLPNNQWCPWASRLLREIPASDAESPKKP